MSGFTKHGTTRFKERFPEFTKAMREDIATKALEHGKCAISFYDAYPELCNYLLNKGNKCNVRVYDGKIFIFDKRSNYLITVYNLPENYLQNYLQITPTVI